MAITKKPSRALKKFGGVWDIRSKKEGTPREAFSRGVAVTSMRILRTVSGCAAVGEQMKPQVLRARGEVRNVGKEARIGG